MTHSLFRDKAIEHQKERLHGSVFVTPSLSKSFLTLLLVAWVVALGIWLATSQFARKETVKGWLEPVSGVTRVYAEPGQGRIKQVLVSEGEEVSKGQPLVIVNGDRVLTDGENLEETLLAEYQKQKRLIEQQLERLAKTYGLRLKDAHQQLTAARQDLAQLEDQIQSVEKHHQLVTQQVHDYSQMASKGHISWFEVENRKEQQLSLKSQLQGLKRERVNQLNRIHQLHNQQALLNQEKQNRIDELNAHLSEIAQQMAQLHGKRAYVLKATISGRVSNLQAQAGQTAVTDKPLLTIVPVDVDMLINVLVPVRAAGFVKPGQSLDIRYDAFPYQKFGLYSGEVVSISDSVLLPQEVSQILVPLKEPVYLAKAKLNEGAVNAYGRDVPLKAGMTLSADIRLKERSILAWLLEPIYSLKGRL